VAGEKKEFSDPDLTMLLDAFIEQHKAGSPTDSDVYWVHTRPSELARLFQEKYGDRVSHGLVKRRLRYLGYGYRKMRKSVATGTYKDRDKQFRAIFALLTLASLGCPVVSIDCKKKERLGRLYRDGKCYCSGPMRVYDHDYAHLSQGKVVPFGLYDILLNKGYVSIGTSGETAAFIKDHLIWWWDNFGIHQYPDAGRLIILCDAGGANCYRHHAFKKHMLEASDHIGIDILICHYPPYSSKWNPIEHKMFPHMHKAMEGVVFTDHQIVKQLIESTHTTKELTIIARVVDKEYPTGIKTDKSQVDYKRIVRSKQCPDLNYICKYQR
jgi:hypothetical protein